MGSPASGEYGLQMQFALLRTMLAVLRANGQETSANADALRRDLENVARELGQLAGARPMTQLARRFGWNAHEVDFVWVTIALAADPRLLVHARALDPNAPQGM